MAAFSTTTNKLKKRTRLVTIEQHIGTCASENLTVNGLTSNTTLSQCHYISRIIIKFLFCSSITLAFLFIIIVPVPRMGQKIITKRTLLAYRLAMKTGTRKSNQLKLVMLGAEGAGKTSSVGSLLDKQFNDDEISTVGASVQSCLTDRIFVSRWQQILMTEQLKNLPELHKSSVKDLMPQMSSKVDSELHSSSDKAEEVVPDLVAAHVEEVVNAKEVSDGDVRIVILDLGGQEIYYEVHFLFLAPEDIVLLTFDASKGLDQPVISRQRLDRFKKKVATRGMQTNIEVLETLFQSLWPYSDRAHFQSYSNHNNDGHTFQRAH